MVEKVPEGRTRAGERDPVPRNRNGQLRLFAGTGSFGAAIAAGKFLHPAGRIHELLFTREKRMARRTDADSNVWTRGTGVISRTARADDIGLLIIRMDTRFHGEKGAPNLASLERVRKG